jgi:signal transduction histidine kinase
MSPHHLLAHQPVPAASVLESPVVHALLAVLVGALVVFLFLRRLRREVKARTAQLEQRTNTIGDLNAQLEISNEELQTSKEEIEAANEELMLLNTDLEVRNRELATLYKVAGSLNQSLDVDKLVSTALERLGDALPPETCSHVLLAENGSDAAPRTVASLRNWKPAGDGHHDDGPLCTVLFGRAAGDGEPFRLGDLRDDPATAGLLANDKTGGSCLAVPLRLRGEFVGALILVSHSFHEFTEEQVWLLASIAESMAAAINNVRLFENLGKTLTDLKQAQNQLLRTEKLRSLGELAAGVAHDFNNVLGIILGNAQFLFEETRNKKLRDGLRAIEQAAKDGARTVERVQDFVTAKGVEGFTRIDLNTVIRELAEIAKTRLKQETEFQNVRVDLTLIEGHIEPVAGDERELREALTNVIFNALDAMPDGGALTIETGREEGQTFVRVTDTGVGMNAEVPPPRHD